MALANVDNGTTGCNHGTGSSLANLTAGTIGFWTYPTSVANSARYIAFKQPAGGGWSVFKKAADGTVIKLSKPRATTAVSIEPPTGTLEANVWQFYAFTFDINSSANCKIYKAKLNSALADVTDTGVSTNGSGSSNSDAAHILATFYQSDAANSGWPGRIANLWVAPRIMGPSEISAVMWRPRTIRGAVLNVIYGEWGRTGLVEDLSGNNNHGLASGLTLASNFPLELRGDLRTMPVRRGLFQGPAGSSITPPVGGAALGGLAGRLDSGVFVPTEVNL